MMRTFWVVFFLISSQAICTVVQVSEDICSQLILEHEPDEDVAYKPDSDQNLGPPADIGGAIKISPPKTINIPIKLDVSKYMRVSDKQAAINQQLLNQSLQAMQSANTSLAQAGQTIGASQSNIQNANQVIGQELSTPIVNLPLLQNTFSQAAVDYQIALNSLQSLPQQIQQVTSQLGQNYTVLQKQFNPYETEATKAQNQAYKTQTQQALLNNANQLASSAQQVAGLSESIKTTMDLLEKSPDTFANKAEFAAQLQGLANQLNQTKLAYDALSGRQQGQLADLNQKLSALNDNQNRYIQEAELGTVQVHQDGRIYFNGQPLFHEDEFALKQACRKLRKK